MRGEGRIHTKGKKVGHCRVSQRFLSMIVDFVTFTMQKKVETWFKKVQCVSNRCKDSFKQKKIFWG